MRQEEIARSQDEVGDAVAVPESLQHLAVVMGNVAFRQVRLNESTRSPPPPSSVTKVIESLVS